MRFFTSKGKLLGLMAVFALVALIASSQTWVTFLLNSDTSVLTQIDVSGSEFAPLVFALCTASIATVFAATISPRVVRFALLLMLALFSAGAVFFSAQSVTQPIASAESELSAALGIIGVEALGASISSTALTIWPWVTVVTAVMLAMLALLSLVPSLSWQGSSRRYSRQRADVPFESVNSPETKGLESTAAVKSDARIDDWDALTDGADPSAR